VGRFQPGNEEYKKRHLNAEKALRTALKRGGLTKCGAFIKLAELWEGQIEKAIAGSTAAAALVIERLDGKPKQQIDANVNVNHAFEQVLIEGRARIADSHARIADTHELIADTHQALENQDPDTLPVTIDQSVSTKSE